MTGFKIIVIPILFLEEFVKRIHLAGLVHDVGKIGVPESVLCITPRWITGLLGRQHCPRSDFRMHVNWLEP